MNFEEPSKEGFTIYSKSGCPFCIKVKNFLIEEKLDYNYINCDDYLIDYKEEFLFFIQQKIGKNVTLFPMIFHNGIYIGGYEYTKIHVEKMKCFESFGEINILEE
jgi:glutaredoxin